MPTVADRKRPVHKPGVIGAKIVVRQQFDPEQDDTLVETYDIGVIGHHHNAAIHALQVWRMDLSLFACLTVMVAIFGLGCAIWGTAALRHYTKTADNVAVAMFHAIMIFSMFAAVLAGCTPWLDYVKHWWHSKHTLATFCAIHVFYLIVACMFVGFFFWWSLAFGTVHKVLPRFWWVMFSELLILMIFTICVAYSLTNWVRARISMDSYRNSTSAALSVAHDSYIEQRIGAERIAMQIQSSIGAAAAAPVGGSVEMAACRAAPLLTTADFPRICKKSLVMLRAAGRI